VVSINCYNLYLARISETSLLVHRLLLHHWLAGLGVHSWLLWIRLHWLLRIWLLHHLTLRRITHGLLLHWVGGLTHYWSTLHWVSTLGRVTWWLSHIWIVVTWWRSVMLFYMNFLDNIMLRSRVATIVMFSSLKEPANDSDDDTTAKTPKDTSNQTPRR